MSNASVALVVIYVHTAAFATPLVDLSANHRINTNYCAASAERIPRVVPAVPVNRRTFLPEPEPLTQISTELRRYPPYLRNILFAYRFFTDNLFSSRTIWF